MVEVVCYDNATAGDAMTAHLRAVVDRWRTIAGVPDDDAAAEIRDDGIDILIDLSGHTARNRLSLFARKPAPVQVTWLGHPGTTGLATMDYILADRFVVQAGEERFFTEKVWRLPDSFLCFAPPRLDVPIAPRPAGPTTLGCFNNWAKVGPETIRLWAEILVRLPEARLLLKSRVLQDSAVRRDALARFAAEGIEPERVSLDGHVPRAESLAAYNLVDIALDPFPFGGGTTTAEALWMGVPVVTRRGERWAGRQSESILAAVGLDGLVAEDGDAYVRTAVELAGDQPRLERLRRTLRAMVESSAFCDGPRFAAALEAAYRGMWVAWCGVGAG